MQLQGLTKAKRHGLHRALLESRSCRVGQPLLLPELLGVFDVLDLRPPRDASPPFLPATRASSLVNSCAVPFWCAARPPLAAIARWACGSIAANPRGVLRVTPLVPRVSAPPSFLFEPVPPPLAVPPPPAPLRSSMLSPGLLGWSAIIDLPAVYSECCGNHARRTSPVSGIWSERGRVFEGSDAQASGRNFRARTNRLAPLQIVDFFTSLTCVST